MSNVAPRRSTASNFVLKGWHVLAMLLAFFATVIAVNVAFSVVAIRTFPGEDVRKSYVQGNRYNEILAERAHQAALGWRATAQIAQRDGAPIVTVTITDKNAEPLDRLTVTGRLRRPATTSADRSIAFTAESGGVYSAPAPGLGPGAWDLQAVAVRGEQKFEINARLSTGTEPR